MPGRAFSIAINADGKRFAVGSSLDGTGQVDIYDFTFDERSTTPALKAIYAKEGSTRSPDERTQIDTARRDSVKRIASTPVSTPIYAVSIRPDGQVVAAAGADGKVRLFDPAGKVSKEFDPAPLDGSSAIVAQTQALPRPEEPLPTETLPADAKVESLDVLPSKIALTNPFAYVQLVVTAKLASGDLIDVTRVVEAQLSKPVAERHPIGTCGSRR